MLSDSMKAHDRYLSIIALASGVFVFAVFVGYGYFSEVFIVSNGGAFSAIESPLLPEGWHTYQGDVWSVGYPAEFDVKEKKSDGLILFSPDDSTSEKIYFSVQQEKKSLDAFRIARSIDETYPDPVEVTIANYPALKYVFGSGRIEFAVAHGLETLLLISDDPESDTASTMLATFSFIE